MSPKAEDTTPAPLTPTKGLKTKSRVTIDEDFVAQLKVSFAQDGIELGDAFEVATGTDADAVRSLTQAYARAVTPLEKGADETRVTAAINGYRAGTSVKLTDEGATGWLVVQAA